MLNLDHYCLLEIIRHKIGSDKIAYSIFQKYKDMLYCGNTNNITNLSLSKLALLVRETQIKNCLIRENLIPN